MSNPTESSSPLVQFVDNFLREKNIKWLLATGVAILLGSSVMLVTAHWEALGQAWKYAILVPQLTIVTPPKPKFHYFVACLPIVPSSWQGV